MTPSENLYKFLEQQEGCKLEAYPDSAGIWTIGIGTTVYKNGKKVKKGDKITRVQAIDELHYEVAQKTKRVAALVTGLTLKQNQFDALNSFAYNLGVEALASSSLLKAIKAGETRTIATNDMQDPDVRKWMQQQGVRAIPLITYYFCLWCKVTNPETKKKEFSEGLIKRRMREAALYLSK